MNINELLDIIKTSRDKNLIAIVGPNTVGKSHSLSLLHRESNGESLLIDEDGGYTCNIERSKVQRISGNYVYFDESNRGKESIDAERIEIAPASNAIIAVAEECKHQLNTKLISSGSRKLNNILDIIRSLNLNSIKIFYFDEPEIFLDDQSIKIIQRIFDVLVENGKKVVFVTHNPRLLEVIKIDIDSIFLLPKIYEDFINLSFEKVRNIYRETGEEISQIKVTQKCDYRDTLQFSKPEIIEDLFLKRLLSSQEFYRSLFYSDIFLLEGLTERCVLEESPKLIQYTQNVFYCGGKYQAPFLIKLFLALRKNVIGVFDRDDDKKGKLSYEMNSYLEGMIELSDNLLTIKFIPNNIEDFLGIEENIYRDILDTEYSANKKDQLEKTHKPYISLYAVKNTPELVSKLEHLFNTNEYSTWTSN